MPNIALEWLVAEWKAGRIDMHVADVSHDLQDTLVTFRIPKPPEDVHKKLDSLRQFIRGE